MEEKMPHVMMENHWSNPRSIAWQELVLTECFKEDITGPDGKIDHTKMARIIESDPEGYKMALAITHARLMHGK